MVEYFFDTYALIEIVKGNPEYARYSEAVGHTAIFNLYEFYAHVLKGNGERLAKQKFDSFKGILIEIKDKHIFAAAAFKLKSKGAHFSYADALGYTIALSEGLQFVTGDNEFRNLPNVMFIR